jgi:hypothetical protein
VQATNTGVITLAVAHGKLLLPVTALVAVTVHFDVSEIDAVKTWLAADYVCGELA